MQNQQGFALAMEPIELVGSDSIVPGLQSHSHTAQRRGRTALITGAFGVSEYIFHTARLLASSERWKRVYCLSRQPPPPRLFDDLGANAAQVEWIAYLDTADSIATGLRDMAMVDHDLDYVFYFSYIQTLPRVRSSSLWYNMDEINRINGVMLGNFLAALRQSDLTLKRFVLQTALRHHGHGTYLGSAAVSYFDYDHRGTFDERVCQAQEDTVARYCQSAGCRLTVTRPPWTIGSVPDSQLRSLLGTGIYADVQALPTQPLLFRDNYQAWEREQIENIGTLNARFEEWLVLSENTTTQSFNTHDGQNST